MQIDTVNGYLDIELWHIGQDIRVECGDIYLVFMGTQPLTELLATLEGGKSMPVSSMGFRGSLRIFRNGEPPQYSVMVDSERSCEVTLTDTGREQMIAILREALTREDITAQLETRSQEWHNQASGQKRKRWFGLF